MPPKPIVGNLVSFERILYLYNPRGLFDFFFLNNGDNIINCTPCFSFIRSSFKLWAEPIIIKLDLLSKFK